LTIIFFYQSERFQAKNDFDIAQEALLYVYAL